MPSNNCLTVRRVRQLAARTAALAAVLLVTNAATASAVPVTISCGFGESWGGFEPEYGPSALDFTPSCQPISEEGNAQTSSFEWGEYLVELTLFNPEGFGNVMITDNELSEAQFQDGLQEPEPPPLYLLTLGSQPPSRGDYKCIPMVTPNLSDPADAPCRNFEIHADDTLSWSNYQFKIDWTWDSHNNGFDGSNGAARVLRDEDDDGFYDEDMCLQALMELPNYVPCQYSQFPFIISGNTDFSTITAAIAVPEPAALSLLGSALLAMWYRRRQGDGATR